MALDYQVVAKRFRELAWQRRVDGLHSVAEAFELCANELDPVEDSMARSGDIKPGDVVYLRGYEQVLMTVASVGADNVRTHWFDDGGELHEAVFSHAELEVRSEK